MKPLLDFLKRFNYLFLFLLLEVLALVLIARSSYYQGSRMAGWGNGVAGTWYRGVSSLTGYFGLKEENDRLARENARLRAEMASSYISYSDSIFTHNDTVYKRQYSYTEAQVIKSSWTQAKNYLMINKGSRQGVRPDMAVISPEGIVGVVVHTTRNFATIMPVLHPESSNSVKIKRNNKTGSLVWEGGDYRYATVTSVSVSDKIYSGDTVITSGFANDFPEGIIVGFAESSETDGSGYYRIRVRLATDFVNLSHVYIINNHFKAEQEALIAKTDNP